MKTISTKSQDHINAIVERDPVAMKNLEALNRNKPTFTHVVAHTGKVQVSIDPVIYHNVRETIIRLALRRYYKPSNGSR